MELRVVRGLLADRTYDLALLRPDAVDQADFDVRPLRTERLVTVLPAHHPLAGRRRINLARLAGERFVMHPSGHRSSLHTRVLEACAAAGFEPSPMIEVAEASTLVVFVAAGLGVALVPEPVRSLGLEGVAYVDSTEAPTVVLALATRKGEDAPAVRRAASLVATLVRRRPAHSPPLRQL